MTETTDFNFRKSPVPPLYAAWHKVVYETRLGKTSSLSNRSDHNNYINFKELLWYLNDETMHAKFFGTVLAVL